MRPPAITAIRSAIRAVENRWVMTSVVRPRAAARNLPSHSASAQGSIALVGSSSTSMGVSRKKARANAIRCHSPTSNSAAFFEPTSERMT